MSGRCKECNRQGEFRVYADRYTAELVEFFPCNEHLLNCLRLLASVGLDTVQVTTLEPWRPGME